MAIEHRQAQDAYSTAQDLLQNNRPIQAAKSLWVAAQHFTSPYQQEMQILAAEILLNHNHFLSAYRYLIQIDETTLELKNLLRKRIADASFYEDTGQYQKVLAALPPQLINIGNESERIQALQFSFHAWFESDHPVAAIEAYIELEKLLDEGQLHANALLLWDMLKRADPEKIREERGKRYVPEIENWLQLAALATPEHTDLKVLNEAFALWKERNLDWPLSDSIKQELVERWHYLSFVPSKVAVLLPLTGDYVKAGKAIRNGFMSEYNATTPPFTVHFYNTDSKASITRIYQRAVKRGIDFVVGPLLKARVKELATRLTAGVQTITLNYLPTPSEQAVQLNDFFQFGLLPEDEAIQVAEKVWDDGHHFVLVLTPDTPWGTRLYKAFKERYLELGGNIRQQTAYVLNNTDYSGTVENLLLLNESHARRKDVDRVLGMKPEFLPRIRDDISATVMFADHKRAVLIYPQIKYHYADKLPVYATSHIYKPKLKNKSRDLDGIYYCEVPIVFQYIDQLPENIKQKSLPRLFALGADAYHLITNIKHMSAGAVKRQGLSGVLSVKPGNKVFRQLIWARIMYSKPVPLDSAL